MTHGRMLKLSLDQLSVGSINESDFDALSDSAKFTELRDVLNDIISKNNDLLGYLEANK